MKETLWHLLMGTNGGSKRIRIIRALDQHPRATSQLADRLECHYNTVRYHLEILAEHDIVRSSGDDYGKIYFLTEEFEQHWEDFERITDHLE